MRRKFVDELIKWMDKDPLIYVLTCDLGFKMFDEIRTKYPERFFNCNASEQAGMGVAVGLALEGKKPFIYSITPFLLYRPFETMKRSQLGLLEEAEMMITNTMGIHTMLERIKLSLKTVSLI